MTTDSEVSAGGISIHAVDVASGVPAVGLGVQVWLCADTKVIAELTSIGDHTVTDMEAGLEHLRHAMSIWCWWLPNPNKNLEKVRFAAEEALQLDGADLYALRTVGALYGQSGDHKRSITLLKRAQQINANDPTTLLTLSQSLLEGEEPDKKAAGQYLRRVIKFAPGTPFAEQAEKIQTKIAYQHFSEGGEVKRKSAVM